jgi:hypothetical protein
MLNTNHKLQINRFRVGLSVLCSLCLAALFMSVYSAFVESGDALRLFDSATSLVRFGDLERDESVWFDPPTRILDNVDIPLGSPEDGMAMLPYQLVAGMVRLADGTGWGYIHTAWLLNVLITALTANVFFWIVLTLGYDERVAVCSTLILGAATIALPYAKSLFREPQVTLALLLVLLCLLRAREHGLAGRWRRVAGWLVGAVIAYVAGYNIKDSSLAALPAFLILVVLWLAASRRIGQQQAFRLLNIILLLLLIGFVVAITYIEPLYNALVALPPLAQRLGEHAMYPRIALHTYLFSVGGSIWGTSPVILLALPGAWLLWRRGQAWLVWFVVLLVLAYAAGHALTTGIHWFGGLSWTPRFLVPTIPFVWLLALPALERVVYPRRWHAWALTSIAVLLLSYSAWIQFNAISLPWVHYLDLLPPNRDPLLPDVPLEWSDGLNRIEYLRWVLLSQSWANLGLDIAWLRAGIQHWLWGFLALVAATLVMLVGLLRRGQLTRWFLPGFGVGLAAWLLLVGGGLRQLYETDGLYLAQKTALHDVMAILQREAQAGDILLLADRTYANFSMNANRLDTVRAIVLPYQPGERASDKEPVKVTSHNPIDYIFGDKAYYTSLLVDDLPRRRDRVWLLAHNGPFTAWATRPLERFFAMHHYTVNMYETGDPTVRLLEYSLINAPNPYEFALPETLTDLQYGEHIRLQGYTLPEGDQYHPGDVLPVSFYWQTDEQLAQDLVVAWFIAPVDASAAALQGRDAQPYEGFAPTTGWQPGIPVWDNHALRLPSAIAPGEYRLWVVLYQYNGDGSTTRLPASGAETLEGTIGVLPAHLTIQAQD